ncbi:caspase family protein [Haloparvum sp. PAK95]|uniref:caspase family protein n=1 Tax=Haloparvum sp. PAK95 TaxID=3418962 RepID=UPI003D2ECF83
MSIDTDVIENEEGLRVKDPVENAQFELYTADPVSARIVDDDRLYFPVDTAVAVETSGVTIPRIATVTVRDTNGGLLGRDTDLWFPWGEYHLEIDPAPSKMYLHFEGELSVTSKEGETRLEFGDQVEVDLGFRSFNESPAGTITTPTDPESLMDAVSLLGSSLSTTSPERSFPTLRGHPPLLEAGSEFSIPERVDPIDTGVTIVVPPTYRYLYPVVSLAFYLGATVVPGDTPRIEGDGWTFPLEPEFERTVSQVLRQTFHFDCIVRTEGFYPVDLYEREQLSVDLNCDRLYDAPLAERLGEYLEVPFETIADDLPQWTLTTDIRPDPANLETLPFVAAELSLIRCPGGESSEVASETGGFSGLLRSSDEESAGERHTSVRTLSRRERGFTDEDTEFIRPESVDTIEHAWIGDGVPLGANKATLEAYRRRIDRESTDESHISVVVVCNDEQMREEGEVGELYGLREMLQFDIEVKYELSKSEMRGVLESDVDFLHYIGHVDERGMQCRDGFLDLTGRDLSVEVDAFLLNACQSYKQGQALVERGSRGGIVTVSTIANSSATRLGRIVARLMNGGFSLRTALHVAQKAMLTGSQYITLGDGGTTLCQSRSGVVVAMDIESTDEDTWNVEKQTFPNGGYGVGTLVNPNIPRFEQNHLVPAEITVRGLKKAELSEFLNLETAPVFTDGELFWSDELLPL